MYNFPAVHLMNGSNCAIIHTFQ